jgi:hypothetical protein
MLVAFSFCASFLAFDLDFSNSSTYQYELTSECFCLPEGVQHHAKKGILPEGEGPPLSIRKYRRDVAG